MALLARFRANSKSFFSLRKANQEHYDRLSELTEPLVSKPKVENTRLRSKTVARQRLRRELSIRDDNLENCSFGLVDARNPFKLQGIIVGPCGTPFEGGIFFVSIDVPSEYPFKPPKIKFKTKVFHPNVASDGTIDIDVLGSQWSPALVMRSCCCRYASFCQTQIIVKIHAIQFVISIGRTENFMTKLQENGPSNMQCSN